MLVDILVRICNRSKNSRIEYFIRYYDWKHLPFEALNAIDPPGPFALIQPFASACFDKGTISIAITAVNPTIATTANIISCVSVFIDYLIGTQTFKN